MSKQTMITVEVWDTFWNENTASSCGIELFESEDFLTIYDKSKFGRIDEKENN